MMKPVLKFACLFFIFFISNVSWAARPLYKYLDGEKISAFTVSAQYTNHEDEVVGLRLVHSLSGLVIHLLQIETVPQAAISIRTYPQSDQGAAHALEHLLVGKGTRGREFSLLSDMLLSDSTAATSERYTEYSFYSGSGIESFYQLFERHLQALFAPDFSDQEARNEVYHFGVTQDQETGKRTLVEKGTVYTEIQSNQGYYGYWYELMKMVLGAGHPMAFKAGGIPDAMRSLSPDAIRQYHQEHYKLGPTTPLILVIDRKQDMESYLGRISTILKPFTSQQNSGLSSEEISKRTVIRPASDAEIKLLPYPSQNKNDRSVVSFAWKPRPVPAHKDLLLLSTFLSVFGSGSQSNLYRSLVDGKTRELDLGLTGVGMKSNATYLTDLPYITFWVNGLSGNQVTFGVLETLRKHVRGKLKEFTNYPDHSKEILDFNRRASSLLIGFQRSLKMAQSNPPGFGQRRNDTGWFGRFDKLDFFGGFKRSLVDKDVLSELLRDLASGKNIWTSVVQNAGLLEEPYGVASIPSPDLLNQLQSQKEERVALKLSELKKQEQTDDDQVALAKFEASLLEAEKQTAELRNKIKRPRLTNHPPMTFDDDIRYAKSNWRGVPTLTSFFKGSSRTDLGLVFDLHTVPRDLYRYLPIFPSLIRWVGLREGERVTSYQELNEQIERDVYNISAYVAADPFNQRYEFRLNATGADEDEFILALEYVRRMTHFNDLDSTNIARIQDLVEQKIKGEDGFSKGYEENWVRGVAQTFRYERDPLYLGIESIPARVHSFYRLKWALSGPIQKTELDDLKHFSEETLKRLRSLGSDVGLISQELAAFQEKGLRARLLEYWKMRQKDIPPHEILDGFERLSGEVIADLEYGKEKVLSDLTRLQGIILNRARMSAQLTGDPAVIKRARKKVETLFVSFEKKNLKNQFRTGLPLISKKILKREPGFKEAYPYVIGYVHEDSVNGNIISTAMVPDYKLTSDSQLIELVSADLLSGGGPHTLFMKTWEAGLAYSNGVTVNPWTGTLNYYADRCPRIRDTEEFVESLTNDYSSYKEDFYRDYILAQQFRFSRAEQSFASRGEGLAADLRKGITPERVKRFSTRLLALRSNPDFLAKVRKTLPKVMDRVMLGRGEAEIKAKAKSIFFFVAPERQLKEIEALAPGKRLYRVWRSDFWLDSE